MTYAKLNAGRVLQAGSDDDYVALAPLGTQLPTALGALNEAFVEVGWTAEEGYSFGFSDSVEKLKGHQGARVIRTKITESETTFAFTALETSLQTLGIQFDIKKSVKGSGVTTHTLSNSRTVRPVAIAIYYEANGHKYLYACSRFEIGERSEIKIGPKEVTAYNVSGTFADDLILITDDPALQAA